jgi:D-psicose/D-tagatose/L-ribulose 3-epimerase
MIGERPLYKHKYGIYYGYWAENRYPDFAELAYKAATLGFDIVEISANPLMSISREARDRISAAARDAGVVHTFIGAVPAETDISSDDGGKRKEGIRYLKEICRLVHQMGGSSISGIFHVSLGAVPDIKKNRRYYLDNSVSSMKEVMKVAEDLGIIVSLEILNRFEQFMLNTACQAVEYVEMVGSQNLKIHLDTFHMNIEEDSIPAAIRSAAGHIGHFHVSENHRGLPGTGHIDFEGTADALRIAGYEGPIIIEAFVKAGFEFSHAFKVWRDMENGDINEALRKSLAYVKDIFS